MARTEVRGGQILDGSVTDADFSGTLSTAKGGTGATSLAAAGIATFPLVFPGVSSPAWANGYLCYDTVNGCLTFYNTDSNVALQIGQEQWVRVRNMTGATIPNGAAVYINGVDSAMPTIALAKADLLGTATPVGLATEAIPTSSVGHVACMGLVNGLDTSAYTAGQMVYLSAATAGALTATAPAAPNLRYRFGRVVVSNATTGSIHIMPSVPLAHDGFAVPADFMLIQTGNTARAVGSGDFATAHRVGRAMTVTSIVYQFDTADASGSTTVELRRNGTQVASSNLTVTAANQADGTATDAARTATINQTFAAGDRINLQVTAVGTTPGKGLRAWLVATWT